MPTPIEGFASKRDAIQHFTLQGMPVDELVKRISSTRMSVDVELRKLRKLGRLPPVASGTPLKTDSAAPPPAQLATPTPVPPSSALSSGDKAARLILATTGYIAEATGMSLPELAAIAVKLLLVPAADALPAPVAPYPSVAAVRRAEATEVAPVHPDDLAVTRFAEAMKSKLALKRGDGAGGWEDKVNCSSAHLSALLRDHVEKGDPLDVANFAMMLHQRGDRIAARDAGPDLYPEPSREEDEAELARLALEGEEDGDPIVPQPVVPLAPVITRPPVETSPFPPAASEPANTFRLRSDNGSYLRKDGMGLTADLNKAWRGTAPQCEQVFKRTPQWRDLEQVRAS